MDWEVRAASLILCLGILLATIQDGIAERRIVCYYTNWSVYRPGTAKFSPQNINPYLCTHLIYAFGGFTKENALKPFDKYQDIEKGGYAKFTGLKTYNKNLKTMLAIGGWNEGSSRFSPMVADPARRREFVKNAVKFLRQNHFDGLDLDWEYPAFRDGGKPRDKDNYANLVQELRKEFERESSKTGRPRLLLSMAMPAGVEYIDKGYDVPRLNEYLDFINLLSYDYHSAYEPAVNHHSPLYPLEEDNEYNYDAELTIDYTITYLLEKGASADKVVLGIPTYGRSYTLFNEDATELGSPADGPGTEGEATREKGYLAYYEICESIADSDEWEVVQPNPKAMGPYAFKGNQWVGYDDEDVVKLKARYVNEKKLGGIMFWSIDNDDFRGKCHGRPYPLIEAAKETLLTDNSRNTIDKTKSVDNRKKTRLQSSQSNTRKLSTSNRRSTTSAPIASKRVPSSRPKYRTNSQANKEEQEDREVSRRSYDPSSGEDLEGRNTVRVTEKTERSKNRNRSKTRSDNTADSTRNIRRKQSRRKGQSKTGENEESLSNKLTTPEPPTTPDPGTDFKCEDEGFFPHPRDCKKYFWCLDSGPSGLGVVAHQFTCPSGLVFNKAADSCDYPRNVICPKASKTSIVSTTRSPITAATSRTTYLHSTTTAKTESNEYDSEEDYEELEESEEEEEEEEEEEKVKEEPKTTTTAKPLIYKTLTRNRPSTTTTTTTTSKPNEPERVIDNEDEEDPKVIKELIDLIKKAGGIEELEKQLLLQEKNSDTKSGSESVTPAAISRSLYERVLNRQANRIGSQRPVLASSEISYVNGPGRAQFEGLDDIPEVKSLRRTQKPQYVTIERSKSVTKESSSENEDIDEDEEDDNTDVASSEEKSFSNPLEDSSSTQRVTPNYVNIRRTRLSTTTSRIENDVEEKEVEIEEEKPQTRRRRPFVSSRQNNEANSETSKSFRNHSNFRKSEKRDDSKSTDRSAEKDDDLSTTKSRYTSVQRFRSTTSKTSENLSSLVPSSEVTSETTSPTRLEEAGHTEVPRTTASTTASLSTTPATTSTSTEIVTMISVEPPENLSSINSKADIGFTTDTVKLVEDSATEILFTTLPAASSSSQLTTTTTTTLASRSTITAVSQPRPFSFTRRRIGSLEATTTATTPLSRSKVADSEVIRLPTLKELIGYPTTYYDDRTVTASSSVLLHLLRNDVDNDINRQNVEESLRRTDKSQESEKEIVQSPRSVIEETSDLWLRQASENKAKFRAPRKEDVMNFNEQVSVTNTVEGDDKRKTSTTSIYLKPTTMRGIPLASIISSPVMRGFYVTRNETDVPSSILTDSSTPFYTTIDTPIKQQTETTLLPDTSTIVAHSDQIESEPNTPDVNIINNKGTDIRKENSTSTSPAIFSKDNVENLSNHEKSDLLTVPVNKPASKSGKSRSNFYHNTTPLSNAHVVSSTTPTRQKIALVVSRYNEATTPLWTGRRIVVRKRNRTTVSPIKDAIRRTESDSIHAATNSLNSASLTTKSTSTSRRRKLFTSTISTIPLIVSDSTASPEILNVHNNLVNSNSTKTEDPENHTTIKAAVTLTNSVIAASPSISEIIPITNDFTTADISTFSDDRTTITVPVVANTPITTTPSTIAVSKAPTVATDATITTSATMNAEVETTMNYSVTDNPTIKNMDAILSDSAVTTETSIETEITSENVNSVVSETTQTITTDPAIRTEPAATNIEVESTFTTNYSMTTIPVIANTQDIATDSAVTTVTSIKTGITTENLNSVFSEITQTTDSAIITKPAAANTEVESTFMTNYSMITIPVTANTQELATDSVNIFTVTNADIEISTIANDSTIPTTIPTNTHDVISDAVSIITASAGVEIPSIGNYSTFTTTAINNTTTIPVTTSASPLTTVISSTIDTQYVHATASMTSSNLSHVNMITTTTPLNVIIPTVTDPNVITSANANIPFTSITSEIPPTTIQSRTSSMTSSKAPITSTIITSTNSAAPTILTTESSTIHFTNPNNLDINGNSEVLTVIATAGPTLTTEIPTFETSSMFISTATAIPKSLSNTNFEATIVTAALSTQEDESSSTPMVTQAPSTLFSVATSITNKATVALERSTTSATLSTTSGESIATKPIIRTTMNAYKPDFVQAISEEFITPEQKTAFKEATETQIQTKNRITSINKSNSARTASDDFTTSKMKVVPEEAISKVIENRKQNQTTSELNTTNYHFNQKTGKRRVLNRTNNWLGSPVTLQRTNQYPGHRATLYRGSRRPPTYNSSSKIIEKNRRRRIRVNSETFNSTIKPDQNTVDVQNTTKDHVAYNRVENVRRKKVVLKKTTERIKKETTTILPIKETTLVQSTVIENETLQVQHEKGNNEEKQKAQESFTTKETSTNSSSNNEGLSDNSQSNLYVAEDPSELEKPRRIMKVTLKDVRPESEKKNAKKETSVDSDSVSTNIQNNYSESPYTDKSLPDKRIAERRMRVVLKSVRPKLEEKNSTIKETITDPNFIDKNLPNNLSNNFNISQNFSNEEETKRKMTVVLETAMPKLEEGYSTSKEINADSNSTDKNLSNNFNISQNFSNEEETKRKMRVVLETVMPKLEEKNSTSEETNTDSSSTDKNLSNNFNITQNFSNEEKARRRMRVVLKRVKSKSEGRKSKTEDVSTEYNSNESLQGTFSNNFYSAKNSSFEYGARRRTRVILKSVKPKSEENNSTVEKTNVDPASTNKSFQDTFLNNFRGNKNLSVETRRRMRVVLKSVKPKLVERNSTVEETSVDPDSTNKSFQSTFLNNFRRGKNLPIEHGTRKRTRVVLKSVKPKSEERNSTVEETSLDSDVTDKDLQGSFSSNFHINENLSDEEEARRRMKVVLKSVQPNSKERDSVAEETSADFDFVSKDPQVRHSFQFLHFSNGLHMSDNFPEEKMMKHSKSEEEEAMTERPENMEPHATTGTSVPVEEDTDRPSLEVTNSGSVSHNPGSGYSNRHRKPTPFTTTAPLTNTLSSTLIRRGRPPVESTLSPRIDFVDSFEGTEYVKPTAVLHDQNADVSEQSIRAHEYAVTLSDPPSSSSDIGRTPLRDADRRKISTTVTPRTDSTTSRTVSRYDTNFRSRQRSRTKDRPTVNATTRPRRPPVIDYDYYEDEVPIIVGKSVLNSKLFLTSKGTIRCLDQGNFPHPYSCKKFITCARMVNGQVIGTEYTCPDKLSFDPVGGICNWSAGLGCKD